MGGNYFITQSFIPLTPTSKGGDRVGDGDGVSIQVTG